MVTYTSGRKHYFGEIQNISTFLPVSKGEFCGIMVDLPNNCEKYLSSLYGLDYLKVPPIEKREKHFITKLDFGSFND